MEGRSYRLTFVALAAAATSYTLQQSMVFPALPALRHDLHTSTAWVTWIFTGFTLMSVVATPLVGRLGDLHGKKRMLLVALCFFFAGCVGAIFAWNIWSLIVWRALQGVGGSVFPLAFAIIKDEFPRGRAQAAIGAISSIFITGAGLGLVTSGLIIDHLQWRWLFVVGAIGVAGAFAMVYTFVPESPRTAPARLDVAGAALLSVTLVSLLLAITEGDVWGWSSGRIVGLFAGAAVLLALWVVHELRIESPMIDVRMLTNRTVALTNATALFGSVAGFSAFVLVPNFVETPRGLSAPVARLAGYGFGADHTHTAFMMLGHTAAGFTAGAIAGRFAMRYGSRTLLTTGMLLCATGAGMLAVLHDHPWQVTLGLAFIGGGTPFGFASMATLIVENVRPTETAVATSMNTVLRSLGGVISAQLSAAILVAHTIRGTSLPAERAYTIAFAMCAGASVFAACLSVFLTPRRRRAVVAAVETP